MTETINMGNSASWRGHRYIGLACRLFIGGVFVGACLFKIKDPEAFALAIATYDILPTSLINLTAVILPWLELSSGLLIIIGIKVRASALLISGMMIMFMIALAVALTRGIDMSCGCFASQEAGDQISVMTMFRDVFFLLPALYVLVFDTHPIGVCSLRRAKTDG